MYIINLSKERRIWDITIDKIIMEIQKRVGILEKKENEQIIRLRNELYGMTDEDYWNLPLGHSKKRKINQYEKKLAEVRCEKRGLNDMLYAYKHSSV